MSPTLQRLAKIARRFPKFALQQYLKIESEAHAQGDLILQLDALYQRYFTLERLNQAGHLINALEFGIKLAEKKALAWQAGKLYEALGRIHYTQGQYRDAINNWSRCIDTSALTGDIASGIEGRIGLSQISSTLGDLNTSARYFKDAENLINQINDPYLASKLAINIGVSLLSLNEFEQAKHQFKIALQFSQQGKITEYIATSHCRLGRIYIKQERFDDALSSLTTGLAIAQKCMHEWLMSLAYGSLAEIYLKKNDFNKAEYFCQQALYFAVKIGSRYNQAEYLSLQSIISEQQNNLINALKYQRELRSIEQEIYRLSVPERLQSLRQYDQLDIPISEQLLELAADPEINHGQHTALQRLLDEASKILRLDWIGIWHFEQNQQAYACKAQTTNQQIVLPPQSNINAITTPNYFQFIHGIEQIVMVSNARLHPAALEIEVLFSAPMPLSMLEIPLQIHGTTIGMVSFTQQQERNAWSRETVMHCSHIVHLIERILSNQEQARIQAELQRHEKMASLGSLVANVAHEVNTPIGAIKSSGRNITDALSHTLLQLPQLMLQLDEPNQKLFIQLIEHTQANQHSLNSREERLLIRSTTTLLEAEQITDAQHKASTLVQLQAHQAYHDYLPLLRHPQSEVILDTGYNLASIISNALNINTAVDRVTKIIFALKTFSRVDPLGERIATHLCEGIETVLTLYNNQIKHHVELIRDYEDIPTLSCFPDELNQVWTNLIHNALQAMQYKGTLTIKLARIADEALVSITDNGCGIPTENLSRIFEVFFTTKAIGEGSGLGLDIVKKIIDKHHGHIEVESTVGLGTTFSIYLPYSAEAA